MHAWCLRLPRFETCSQQRKATGRPLSIRKFLACTRPSKLTTTKIYTHGVLLYCVSCPRNADYWCCAISSSTAFSLSLFFYTRLFLHCCLMCISDLSNAPWKVGQFSFSQMLTYIFLYQWTTSFYVISLTKLEGVPSILYCEKQSTSKC